MRSAGRFVPPLLLMAVIFFFSALSGLPRAETDLDVALRKLAHMTEFGLLWWLWLRALLPASDGRRAALGALTIAVAYAVSDELHQSFVAGRQASGFDVAIDAAGMGVAAALWVAWTRRGRGGRRAAPARADRPNGVKDPPGGQAEPVSVIGRVDAFQQKHPAVGFPLAVVYKYFDDQGAYLAALITYYGLIGVFPLLLLGSTILGLVLQGDPELQRQVLDSALSQFPVIGDELGQPGRIGGGTVGLVVGGLGSLYGGLGVAQAAQNAMNAAWSVPRNSRPNPFKARAISLLLLATVGLGVIATTVLSAGLTNGVAGEQLSRGNLRVLVLAATTALNVLIFVTAFRLATARPLRTADVLPGALLAALLYLGLQVFGAGYVGWVIDRSSATSGAFAVVLGLIAFVYATTVAIVLCVEVNVVRVERLWPRALLTPFTDEVDLTRADRHAYTRQAEAQRLKGFEDVDVTFGPRPRGGDEAEKAT